ncbi:MAG: hypothetical protein EXS09_18780 [Gemmataceae bacterium]|nr:hypothetical protein [Gemmataceae bacterium]
MFGQTKVWQFHLSLSAKEFEAMQPAAGGFFGGFGGPPGGPPKQPAPPPKASDPNRDVHKSVFNMDFPIAKGEFSAEGKTYKDVAMRYKGNGSYLPTMTKLKRNFKVELDRYSDDQRFHGHKTINLNASAVDPTRLREAIGFGIYRDAGVAAPRTAFAEVTLTAEGKWDKEYLGLYTVIEQVDRAFLKNHFKDGTGLLLKPERMRGLDYLGDDWDKYKANYNPKHEATKEQAKRTIDFVKLVNVGDDAQFNKEIGSYLDVDQFLRYMGVTAMLSNMDSFFSLGHNYYMYLNPKTNKFVFMPWDLDLALAGFPFIFSPEVQIDLSLSHPYPGECKLADRLLAIKDVSEAYQKVLKDIAKTCFTKERLIKDIEVLEGATKEIIARETKTTAARKEAAGIDFSAFSRVPDLRTFVDKRIASVTSQLEGKSKGQIPPAMPNFGGPPPGGPGGPAGPPPRIGDILPGPAQDMLRLTPEQRKKLAEIQKGVDKQVEELLTEEQRATLKRIRESRPGGPGGPGKEPPKFPKQ